jgi:hypothetical protein
MNGLIGLSGYGVWQPQRGSIGDWLMEQSRHFALELHQKNHEALSGTDIGTDNKIRLDSHLGGFFHIRTDLTLSYAASPRRLVPQFSEL